MNSQRAVACLTCSLNYPRNHVQEHFAFNDREGQVKLMYLYCQECTYGSVFLQRDDTLSPLYPSVAYTAPAEVLEGDPGLASDIVEAHAVLPLSAKASAALSRRALQHILRERAGVAKASLKKEIDDTVAAGSISSDLADLLHRVRKLGNIAAHPDKDAAGEIVPVEPGEASFLLEVVEELMDHYYVKPARRAAMVEAIDAKSPEPLT